MIPAFDDRIVRVTLETESGLEVIENLAIRAKGQKLLTADSLPECQIEIFNLTKEKRNFLITETSLLNLRNKPKQLILEVGRKSTGVFELFRGEVIAANPSQPPDIGLMFQSLTGAAGLSAFVSTNSAGTQKASTVVKRAAEALPKPLTAEQLGTVDGVPAGILLDESTPTNIANHKWEGSPTGQIKDLARSLRADKDLYFDGGTVVFKDKGKPLEGDPVLISAETGMVGVPEITPLGSTKGSYGVRVRTLINKAIRLGGAIKIESKINPAANGEYEIRRIIFEVANREKPFYFIIDATTYLLGGPS